MSAKLVPPLASRANAAFRRGALLLFAGLVVVAGCIADDPLPEADADGAEAMAEETAEESTASEGIEAPAEVVIEADFVEVTCAFNPPPGANPTCGTVTVPEDWAAGTGEIILTVAVYSSSADAPAADPVVYLDGGPGSHALASSALLAADLLQPLLAQRDVIVFDQRGAGQSDPRLDCPELTAMSRELEDIANPEPDDVDDRFGTALTECATRLTGEGIDLNAYNSMNNAHDVEAIRVALGYDEWNLLGISYGTRLGLEVMRQHPDGVRSAVLDSVFPPQVDSVLENPGTFLASYDAVVAACAEEPECSAAGDLDERVVAAVQTLEADPITVEVSNLLTGERDDVLVDGDAVVGVITQALYSPEAFGDLPELVGQLELGETAAISSFLSLQRTNEELFTDGMFYAIVCNEEIPFADPDEVEAGLPADPFELQDRFDLGSNTGTNAFKTCAAFNPSAPAPPAAANEPVTSDIPSLVMAGRFDPVTPVAWSEAAAANLSNSYLVVDPFNSHGISPGECGMTIVNAFLSDPTTEPDASCFDDGDVSFLAPVDSAIVPEPGNLTSGGGRELVLVRPAGWTDGGFGDSYRQASLLDPTAIFHIADNPTLKLGIELVLDQQYGVVLGPSADAGSIGGRPWTVRTGSAGDTTVEWYATEIDGVDVVVVLVSTVAELEANRTAVLLPALEGIDVK